MKFESLDPKTEQQIDLRLAVAKPLGDTDGDGRPEFAITQGKRLHIVEIYRD